MKRFYTLAGFIIIMVCWQLIYVTGLISALILPSPIQTFTSFSDMLTTDHIISASIYSIKLNVFGYVEAILIAIPMGFILGLSLPVRKTFAKYIDALRYIPLTAAVGLFIAGFGIEDTMKIQFLAFAIFIYVLPVVVQRIDEVSSVHLDMAYTLGATKLQTILTVYLPSVLSRVSDDIRVLVAISWTYLVVAELVNKTDGLGALAYTAARQSRNDKVFAVLILIVVIGLMQDKLFKIIDNVIFPYKNISTK